MYLVLGIKLTTSCSQGRHFATEIMPGYLILDFLSTAHLDYILPCDRLIIPCGLLQLGVQECIHRCQETILIVSHIWGFFVVPLLVPWHVLFSGWCMEAPSLLKVNLGATFLAHSSLHHISMVIFCYHHPKSHLYWSRCSSCDSKV